MRRILSFVTQSTGGMLLAAALAIAPGGVTVVHAGSPDKQTVRGPVRGAIDAASCEVDGKSAVEKGSDAHREIRAKLQAEMAAAVADGSVQPLDGNGYNYALEDDPQRAELMRAAREAAAARR